MDQSETLQLSSYSPAIRTMDGPQMLSTIVERVGTPRRVDVDIVVPVYNEQEQLSASVITLTNYLSRTRHEEFPYTWNIVVADNASTDATWPIAAQLASQYPDLVRAVKIAAKGRGRALKLAWGESEAKVVAYMDADLSTDIRSTNALIWALLRGGADVATGCRLCDESEVTRSLKREVISQTYNALLRSLLGAAFRDAQCGFKAMTASAARHLLPYIQDDEWFFDTEMLLLAQATNMRIYEFPVHWVEDAGTTVNIPDTIAKDLAGMWRMSRTLKLMRRRQTNRMESLRGAYSQHGISGGAANSDDAGKPENSQGHPASASSPTKPSAL